MSTLQNQVIDQLARTKGWTMFMGVMLWITAALVLLAAIAVIIGGIASNSAPMAQLIGMAVAYVIMAILYVFPALKLTAYSSKIKELMQSPGEENLAAALNEQRIFWKYTGIVTIFVMALYLLFIVGMLIFGLTMFKTIGAGGL